MSPPGNLVPSDTDRSQDPIQTESAGQNNMKAVVSASKKVDPVDPDEEILTLARERFRRVASYESEWRASAIKELKFVDSLEHWTEDEKKERTGRPCLTFDRIGPPVDQCINDARQNPPEPLISPVGDRADRWTAEILQGLLRQVENESKAEIAYLTGYEHAVKIGRGWVRVHFEFEDEDQDTWLQRIVIKRVANPFSIYPDPAADEFDYSDMGYCFATEDLAKDVFEDLYPGVNPGSSAEMTGVGDEMKADWYPDGAIRVAEYWWVSRTEKWIVQLQNGTVKDAKDLKPEEKTQVQNRRRVLKKTVNMAKMNGVSVLYKRQWPGKYIPLIPILGKEVWREKKRSVRGMVRPAMDANLSYDYMRSKEAEAVGLAPLSTWLAAVGQLDGQEAKWTDSNRKAYTYLQYVPQKDEHGNYLPPPTRVQAEPAVQAISGAIAHADNDVKSTTSTYDDSLGRRGPESSGIAINARQRESDNAHFNYHQNLGWSMMHVGRVFVDLVPPVYPESRLLSIIDPDRTTVKQIMVNSTDQTQFAKGQDRIYHFHPEARYGVTLGFGPSYASKRAQQQQSLVQILPAMPILVQRAPDLVLKEIGLSKEICDRVRPPDVQVDQEGDAPPLPPQVQAAMAQQGQLIQALSKELTAATEDIKTQRLKLESAERIATANNATQAMIAEMKFGTEHAIEILRGQMTSIATELEALRGQDEADAQRQHEKDLQQQQLDAQQQQPPAQPEAPPQAA